MCNFSFPGVADLKMGDLYLIVNFFYVFATLVEFALVSYRPPTREKWKEARKKKFASTFKGLTVRRKVKTDVLKETPVHDARGSRLGQDTAAEKGGSSNEKFIIVFCNLSIRFYFFYF